jgi:hypothetical protein
VGRWRDGVWGGGGGGGGKAWTRARARALSACIYTRPGVHQFQIRKYPERINYSKYHFFLLVFMYAAPKSPNVAILI